MINSDSPSHVDLYRTKARVFRELVPSLRIPEAREELSLMASWYEKLANYAEVMSSAAMPVREAKCRPDR